MKYTPTFLIEKRREKWQSANPDKRIEEDKRFREAVANEIIENKEFREEIIKYPEYLVELEFVIVDKEQNTVPFFLNEVQKTFIATLNQAKDDYNNKRILAIKLNVLKGRQQGFTTIITAYQLACAILNKNFSGYTLSDKADNTEAIFQNKAKFPYDQLPDKLKHTEKYNNRRQLLFEKTNSNWSVDTATKDVGRSKTINFFHGSECAFWNGGMQSIQAGLGEALTKNCIQIYETTANGFNDFQKLWNSGTCINCFYQWWLTYEYRMNFETEEIKSRKGLPTHCIATPFLFFYKSTFNLPKLPAHPPIPARFRISKSNKPGYHRCRLRHRLAAAESKPHIYLLQPYVAKQLSNQI